jgi:hypothetical protein
LARVNTSPPVADSVLFLLFSLTFIATFLYLPQHIAFIISRAWFYMHGDSVDVLELAKGAVEGMAQSVVGTGTTAAMAETTAQVLKEL